MTRVDDLQAACPRCGSDNGAIVKRLAAGPPRVGAVVFTCPWCYMTARYEVQAARDALAAFEEDGR